MAYITGAVYDPPNPKLPLVVVLIGPDGEVLTARVVPSHQAGEKLIEEVLNSTGKRVL